MCETASVVSVRVLCLLWCIFGLDVGDDKVVSKSLKIVIRYMVWALMQWLRDKLEKLWGKIVIGGRSFSELLFID